MTSPNRSDDDEAVTPSEPASISNPRDLEKAETIYSISSSTRDNAATGEPRSRVRVTRTESLRRRNIPGRFTHPLTHIKTTEAEIVDFDGPDDPYRPVNWPFRKKVITTLLYGLTTMGSTWASSIYSPAVNQIAEEYHVSSEVSLLGLSFLLLGFGIGPMIWAPLSEVLVIYPISFLRTRGLNLRSKLLMVVIQIWT